MTPAAVIDSVRNAYYDPQQAQQPDPHLPANWMEYFAVTRGQQLNFISTSKSTGYVTLTEMS